MRFKIMNKLAIFGMICAAQTLQAQEAQPSAEAIVVTGKSPKEEVEALGKAITRPSRMGKPVARFDAPLCVKVSGLPDEMAEMVAARINQNIAAIEGLETAKQACKPNAFVGILNNVNQTVDKLREDEPWLFEGLLSYQVERIYQGSQAARAWHVFDVRNLDGTAIPGRRKGSRDLGEIVNNVENASRFIQLRTNLSGAVVLIETSALKEKTFRQLADYATIRILASTSDEIDDERAVLPTILTLFGGGAPPLELTDFDRAYLAALYELPANSMDGQIIAAATSRYVERLQAEQEE